LLEWNIFPVFGVCASHLLSEIMKQKIIPVLFLCEHHQEELDDNSLSNMLPLKDWGIAKKFGCCVDDCDNKADVFEYLDINTFAKMNNKLNIR
jgi:hypothetical protein